MRKILISLILIVLMSSSVMAVAKEIGPVVGVMGDNAKRQEVLNKALASEPDKPNMIITERTGLIPFISQIFTGKQYEVADVSKAAEIQRQGNFKKLINGEDYNVIGEVESGTYQVFKDKESKEVARFTIDSIRNKKYGSLVFKRDQLEIGGPGDGYPVPLNDEGVPSIDDYDYPADENDVANNLNDAETDINDAYDPEACQGAWFEKSETSDTFKFDVDIDTLIKTAGYNLESVPESVTGWNTNVGTDSKLGPYWKCPDLAGWTQEGAASYEAFIGDLKNAVKAGDGAKFRSLLENAGVDASADFGDAMAQFQQIREINYRAGTPVGLTELYGYAIQLSNKGSYWIDSLLNDPNFRKYVDDSKLSGNVAANDNAAVSANADVNAANTMSGAICGLNPSQIKKKLDPVFACDNGDAEAAEYGKSVSANLDALSGIQGLKITALELREMLSILDPVNDYDLVSPAIISWKENGVAFACILDKYENAESPRRMGITGMGQFEWLHNDAQQNYLSTVGHEIRKKCWAGILS